MVQTIETTNKLEFQLVQPYNLKSTETKIKYIDHFIK